MDKSKMKGNHSVAGAEISAFKTSKTGKAFGNNVGPIPEAEGIQGSNHGNRKRKQKSSPFKVRMDCKHNFSGFKLLLYLLNHLIVVERILTIWKFMATDII